MDDRPLSVRRPPRSFEDAEGRSIDVRERENLRDEGVLEMYRTLDGRCRAMGIPPVTEADRRDWLESLESGLNLVAASGDRVVGHAALLPAADDTHELAIFVHQAFQNAGIGTELLRTLLSEARAVGISSVWLTVACGNGPAKKLFRSVGFDVSERNRRQLTMTMEL